MIRGRVAARSIVEWVVTHYEFSDNGEISDFYYDYLALQTRSILQLKLYAQNRGILSSVKAASVEKLIKKSYESAHPFWASWEKHQDKELLDFSLTDLPMHDIKLRDSTLKGRPCELYKFGQFSLIFYPQPRKACYTTERRWMIGSGSNKLFPNSSLYHLYFSQDQLRFSAFRFGVPSYPQYLICLFFALAHSHVNQRFMKWMSRCLINHMKNNQFLKGYELVYVIVFTTLTRKKKDYESYFYGVSSARACVNG
jgi:hypothetical protein